MHALITGGAGFIGSHLADALMAQSWRVTAIDDLSTGRRQNLASLESRNGFRLVAGSITDAALLEGLVRQADAIFHLASAVGVRLIVEKPVQTIESIVNGTEHVLRLASKHRRCVLMASSSEVYGKGSKVPFAEGDDVVLGPTTTRRWAYGCGKMLDEFLALAHWHESRLPVVCVRLFNTVGPRQTGRYGMVLPRFVDQAMRGHPITVYGDGEQTRCFCHVKEVIAALINLSQCKDAQGRVINVGSDHEVTINQLAQRVKVLAGSDSQIVHVPYDQAYVEGFEDMRRRVPDLTLARRLVGFKPRQTLDDIVRDLVAFWRQAPSTEGLG